MALRTSFYIELPQAKQMMINVDGINYNLTTWLGVADLSTLSRDDLRTLVLEPCLQDGPIALAENNFNLTEANIDSTKVREDIQARLQADLPRNLYPALPGVQRPTPHGS